MADLLRVVRLGDRAVLRDGMLRIYSIAGVNELDLAAAPTRSLRIPSRSRGLEDGLDIEVARALGLIDLGSLVGLPMMESTTRALVDLARFSAVCHAAESLERIDPARLDAAERGMVQATAYLLGRGLGLTPSGDDVLMGYGTALRYLHGAGSDAPSARFFDAVEELAPGKTTAVSEAYLEAMCDGRANEDYIELLAALESGRTSDLDRCVARILKIGHTSGADGLLGLGTAFCCLSM
ncbi:MAG: DUF2877 domain-containing protein [Collinsella sp.]|nr:DUF2877 domain-containing protein [Collinsella sp.]